MLNTLIYSLNRYVVDTGATADTSIVSNNGGCLIVGGEDSNVTISNGTIVNEVETLYSVLGTKDGHL